MRIDIRDKMSSQVLQLVVDHEVDFGLPTLPLLHPQVTTEVLFTREDVVICPWLPTGAGVGRVAGTGEPVSTPGAVAREYVTPAPGDGLPMQVAMNLAISK